MLTRAVPSVMFVGFVVILAFSWAFVYTIDYFFGSGAWGQRPVYDSPVAERTSPPQGATGSTPDKDVRIVLAALMNIRGSGRTREHRRLSPTQAR